MGISARSVRTLATAFVLTDALVLGAFAVRVHDVSTTVTAHPTAPVVKSALPTHGTPGAVRTTPVQPAIGATSIRPGGGVVLTSFTTTTPSHTVTKPGKPGGSSSTPGHGSGSGSGTTARAIPACPIKLTDNNQSGGLQSLVQFAPAFGPFTPEAFAAASAYQPLLELVGPLLAQYPQLAPVIGPYAAQFVVTAAQGTGLLGQLVAPLYGPYKNQVVTAETKLAAALAPYSESLAYSPLGGCVVELENALVAQSKTAG